MVWKLIMQIIITTLNIVSPALSTEGKKGMSDFSNIARVWYRLRWVHFLFSFFFCCCCNVMSLVCSFQLLLPMCKSFPLSVKLCCSTEKKRSFIQNSSITQNIGCLTRCADRQQDRKEGRFSEGRMAGQAAESGEDKIILVEFISIDFHLLTKSYHYLTHTAQGSIANKILCSDRQGGQPHKTRHTFMQCCVWWIPASHICNYRLDISLICVEVLKPTYSKMSRKMLCWVDFWWILKVVV